MSETLRSLFEFYAEATERESAMDDRVQLWQVGIKPGDHFRKPNGWDLPIYGEVLAEEEPRAPPKQHYRLCRCYSIACSEGELGDVHVSTIERLLSREQFEAARQQGWYP